jgi:hypothetical protein
LLFTSFFAAALARQRFFYAFSFAGLQIKRVTLYFLDDVLGLYLPLEPAKCVFKGLSLLKSDFSQLDDTPQPALTGPFSYGKLALLSQAEYAFIFLRFRNSSASIIAPAVVQMRLSPS